MCVHACMHVCVCVFEGREMLTILRYCGPHAQCLLPACPVFVVGFSPASYFIDEDNRFLTLFVVRQYGTLAETVTVLVTTVDGTAEGVLQICFLCMVIEFVHSNLLFRSDAANLSVWRL